MSFRTLLFGHKPANDAPADTASGHASGQHQVQSLTLIDLPANVIIDVADQPFVTYDCFGPQDILDLIRFSVSGNTLSAEGPSAHVMIQHNDSGTITVDGHIYEFGPHKPLPTVTFKVPRGTALRVFDNLFDVTIGDTLASVSLRAGGASRMVVGRIGNLEAKISGTAVVRVSYVKGAADLHLSGTAHLLTYGGDITVLDASTSGASILSLDGTVGEAKLRSAGASYLSVETVGHVRHQSSSGVSSINIQSVG